MDNKKATLELGTKPVGKLLVQYATPAIVAMTAASLYNIVDSIFIGQGVGPLAISGLAITFPFMNLASAFGAAVGVGASTFISVKLGQKDYQTAENILGNTLTLNLIIGIGFTLLTLLSATVIPVEDCGCFGEALKLTPWETFYKNLALLPMALVVWWRYRPDKIFAFNPLEIVLTVTFFFLTMYLGYYCYRHLPLIDFLPYKVGVNIWEGMHAPVVEPGETETVLVYRNIETGKLREFSLDDTAWQDAEKWEWVDTRTTDEMPAIRPLMSEFSLRDAEGDATEEIVTAPGRVYLLCVTSFDRLPRGCAKRFAKVVRRAAEEGARVVCLTPQPLYGVTYHDFGSGDVRCYNIDASTMKTMLRANNGMVVLEDGVIRAKKNCRDIRP